jgi:hypothetical protein
MIEKQVISEPETVACEICLKAVPKSVAQSREGTEYVYYFCGAACYSQWQTQQKEEQDRSVSSGGGSSATWPKKQNPVYPRM